MSEMSVTLQSSTQVLYYFHSMFYEASRLLCELLLFEMSQETSGETPSVNPVLTPDRTSNKQNKTSQGCRYRDV